MILGYDITNSWISIYNFYVSLPVVFETVMIVRGFKFGGFPSEYEIGGNFTSLRYGYSVRVNRGVRMEFYSNTRL